MNSEYVNLNPYHYTANNPIAFIDPDGRAMAYIVDADRAWGAGHGMLAIGNDKDGWNIISFERLTTKESKFGGAGALKIKSSMGSLEDIMNSGFTIQNYELDKALIISTTPEQDAAALATAIEISENPGEYHLTERNCGNVAVKIANSGGKQVLENDLFPNKILSKNKKKGTTVKSQKRKREEAKRINKYYNPGSRRYGRSQNERDGYGPVD